MADVLAESLTLRMPVFPRGTGSREQIDTLQEYMLLTAFKRGELAEERNNTLEQLDDLEDKVDAVDLTYYISDKPKTDKGMEAAKAEACPNDWKAIKKLRRRKDRLWGEMERLDRDATVASRAYTFLTGS